MYNIQNQWDLDFVHRSVLYKLQSTKFRELDLSVLR
jgi:hypothetical protein